MARSQAGLAGSQGFPAHRACLTCNVTGHPTWAPGRRGMP
jgi:hypothetical protein